MMAPLSQATRHSRRIQFLSHKQRRLIHRRLNPVYCLCTDTLSKRCTIERLWRASLWERHTQDKGAPHGTQAVGHAWWRARLWAGNQGQIGEDDVALRHGKVVHHDCIWDGDREVAHHAPFSPNLEVVQVGLLHTPVAETIHDACAPVIHSEGDDNNCMVRTMITIG